MTAAALHVESVGAGPPLVLLHGFAMHGGVFAPVVPALARRHRVHVVDLPGHGRSPGPVPPTLEAMADAVADAVATARSADPATRDADAPVRVLGWSFGGQVALAWALRRPAAVAGLALVCTTPSFVVRDDWPCAMAAATLRRFGDELAVSYRLTLQRFLTLQVQGSEAGRATLAALRTRLFERGTPSRAALADTLDLIVDGDLRAAAARIDTPACVIAGPRDTLAPAAAGEWLARTLPRGRYAAIDGAAHAPFLSHPAAFLDALFEAVDA